MKNFIFVFILLSLSSCATIFNGKSQEIVIDSEPKGALVIDEEGNKIGKTPLKTDLSRDTDHEFYLIKPGYEPQYVNCSRSLSIATLLYILPGGILMAGYDSKNGSQYTFEDEQIVKLKKVEKT